MEEVGRDLQIARTFTPNLVGTPYFAFLMSAVFVAGYNRGSIGHDIENVNLRFSHWVESTGITFRWRIGDSKDKSQQYWTYGYLRVFCLGKLSEEQHRHHIERIEKELDEEPSWPAVP